MERHQGTKGIALVECINPRLQRYRVRWDVQPHVAQEQYDSEESRESNMVTFVEKEFSHKPSLEEVKDAVLGWMNDEIDRQIVEGFAWNGMAVWLSSENQFNYKAAYDLAIMSEGANLPVVFKFGSTDNPVYYKFTTNEELGDFYLKAMAYIQQTLADGWNRKDNMEWGVYEEALGA